MELFMDLFMNLPEVLTKTPPTKALPGHSQAIPAARFSKLGYEDRCPARASLQACRYHGCAATLRSLRIKMSQNRLNQGESSAKPCTATP